MMRTQRNRLLFVAAIIVLLVLGLLLRPQVVQHATPDENIIFSPEYQLSDFHPDDLVVVGSALTLEAGSRVGGDASLAGQSLGVAGQVDGDLTLVGEDVIILPGAEISGDVNVAGRQATIGGTIAGDLRVSGASLTILPSAQLEGNFSFCGQQLDDQRPNAAVPECLASGIDPYAELIALRDRGFDGSTFAMLVVAVVGTLVLTGTSALAVTFCPRQVSHIEEAMRARPRSFAGVGIATYALVLGLFFAVTFLLAIFPPLGFIFIPIFLIIGLALFVLSLSGLVTLAVIFGDWLLRRFSRTPQPPLVAAVAGSLVLSAGVALVALLPFGFFVSAALLALFSSAGLGASLFTRIGTRPVGRTYFVQG